MQAIIKKHRYDVNRDENNRLIVYYENAYRMIYADSKGNTYIYFEHKKIMVNTILEFGVKNDKFREFKVT